MSLGRIPAPAPRIGRLALGGLVPLGAILLLEGTSRAGWIDPVLFPAPTQVAAATGAAAPELARHCLHTLGVAGVAFFSALLLAVPAGLVLGRFQGLRHLFRPSVDALRTLPSAAVIPVAILLLGIDERMQVAVVVFGTAWPILLATLDAVHGIPPVMRDTVRFLHLDAPRAFLRVYLPATLPGIFTGARISLSIALILTVTVEMIAGNAGLGFYVLDTERSFRFAEMYGSVVILGVLGVAVNGALAWLERRVVFWR